MPTLPRISLPLEECLFFHGLYLFNAQRFFACHEVWEHVWRRLPPSPKRSFYHGLIQVAVCLEHYRRGNVVGVTRLHRTYPQKFAALPPLFMGVDLPTFLQEMERTLASVIASGVLPEGGAGRSWVTPRLTLQYDPFSTREAASLNLGPPPA